MKGKLTRRDINKSGISAYKCGKCGHWLSERRRLNKSTLCWVCQREQANYPPPPANAFKKVPFFAFWLFALLIVGHVELWVIDALL